MPSTGPSQDFYAVLTPDDLVTGEAVALDLPAAGLATRMVSGLIDVLVTVVALVVVLVVLLVATIDTDDALASVAITVTTIAVFVGIPVTVETLTRGRTLGKLAMGLRTVRDDAGPISFQHALVRALVGYVEIYATFGVAAFFTMLLNSRGKRLGDLTAGTYVVRERVKLQLPYPPAMPPPLAAWAAAADVAGLPTGLGLAVRQFLGRSVDLSPASRAQVAAHLATRVAEHVAPPPPSGTPPEAFLAAVVATRRERDLARLRLRAERRARLTRA